MITYSELIKGYSVADIPIAHQHNIEDYLVRVNKFRKAYGKPMICTSGYRSWAHHLKVYFQLAMQRGVEFVESKVPKGSQHLVGRAADWKDSDGSLYQFCLDNVPLLEECGLWVEEKDDQPRVHLQSVPPKSGKRFFKA